MKPLNESSNILFLVLNDREHYRRPLLSRNEIIAGPDCEDLQEGGHIISLRTATGVYSAKDVVKRIPKAQQPDLIVVKADATSRNLAIDLDDIDCPKLLVAGNTQNLMQPLQLILSYAASQQFEFIVSDHKRHHLHFFNDILPASRIWWLPGFMIKPYRFETPHVVDPRIRFVGQMGNYHPYRCKIINQLCEDDYPIDLATGDQRSASEIYSRSLINLNISLNADLNLRVFEVLAAGGFLLTDQLSHASGLYDLFTPGMHLNVFSDIDDIRTQLDRALTEPEKCREIAKAGNSLFWQEHSPEAKRADFFRLVNGGILEPGFSVNADPRVGNLSDGSFPTMARIIFYELLQEIHLNADKVGMYAFDDTPPVILEDVSDLPRLQVSRQPCGNPQYEAAVFARFARVPDARRFVLRQPVEAQDCAVVTGGSDTRAAWFAGQSGQLPEATLYCFFNTSPSSDRECPATRGDYDKLIENKYFSIWENRKHKQESSQQAQPAEILP